MKKTKFLMALACFGLLITGCNPGSTPSESKPASTSGNPSTSSKPSTSTPSSSSTSSVIPDPETYYEVEFGAANEALNDSGKWGKGKEYKWTFSVPKHYTKVVFAVGAQMSSSSHGDRSLYTNHEGASSNDSFESNEANDGTCRITLKANGVQQEVTHDTYEAAGLTNSEMNYFKLAEFAVNAGEVEVSLTTHAKTGYRLMLGEGARLYYKAADESATPTVVPAFEGYKVNFVAEHCKVYVYSTKNYATETPVETNSCVAKDETGKVVAYDPDDLIAQPQVSFKVVCDEGYTLNASNFTITGKYNKLKQGPSTEDGLPDEQHYRITKVQEDLTVTITPVQGQQAKGYKIAFVPTNCTIKVYVGAPEADDSNLDTAEDGVYYARSKDSPYDFTFADPQVNFKVVCNDGYEFKPTIDADNKVDFITHPDSAKDGYNKFQNKGGYYNLTKVSDDLTITITATEAQQVLPEPTPDGTKVTKTVAELKTENSWADATAIGSFTLGQVDVTLTGDAGDTKYYDNGSNLRIYVAKNGGTGSVAFQAKDGYKIVAVKITYVWNNNIGTFPLESDAIGMVNATSKTYEIANPGSKNEQMRITAFEIYYDVAA